MLSRVIEIDSSRDRNPRLIPPAACPLLHQSGQPPLQAASPRLRPQGAPLWRIGKSCLSVKSTPKFSRSRRTSCIPISEWPPMKKKSSSTVAACVPSMSCTIDSSFSSSMEEGPRTTLAHSTFVSVGRSSNLRSSLPFRDKGRLASLTNRAGYHVSWQG